WSCDETIRCVVEQNREKWNNHNHQISGSGTKKSKSETIFFKNETKKSKNETITSRSETIPAGSFSSPRHISAHFSKSGKKEPLSVHTEGEFYCIKQQTRNSAFHAFFALFLSKRNRPFAD
ncbi:hypothetical protein, partial [Ectobacillus ponti]